MSYIDNFRNRWEPHFGKEPWWGMQLTLYEGPGHDWEGADEAMRQVMYVLAKARGIDTRQACSHCKLIIDEAKCLGSDDACSQCDAEHEARWEAQRKADDAHRIAHQRWYESLTQDQRAEYDRQQQANSAFLMHGLIKRDVQ